MRARLMRAAVVCFLAATVIVVYGARQIMGWFQSWSGYRCYGQGPLSGDMPAACEHHVEYGPAGLVMLAVVTVVIFLPFALMILRRAKTNRY
ncbi:hypothetical protein CLV92_1186 [Kineococcus xinjiangensis]|uniref:Uncharacterized protein n=1 Tax=Kineococcus xinjiangensis TaxID=512762 RepID=A0A2S6ICP5_9ACTN|nr:hypothetical protein CLV92_1186 [Kineococcus xinjiangensis]